MSEPVRRFYERVTVVDGGDGFGITLDARTLKTPKRAAFTAPTRALADAIAAEWAAQGQQLIPATMPITQLAFAAIDWTAVARPERTAYVASFGATDLCCHRASAPAELVARQAQLWDPLVAWARATLDVDLPVIEGVVAADIAPDELRKLEAHALDLSDFDLTALSQAAGLSGSAVIAFALTQRQITGPQAYDAATLDDEWSLERWGEDAEARARLDAVRAEFDVLDSFITALRP